MWDKLSDNAKAILRGMSSPAEGQASSKSKSTSAFHGNSPFNRYGAPLPTRWMKATTTNSMIVEMIRNYLRTLLIVQVL
jgi:hypothetical protein